LEKKRVEAPEEKTKTQTPKKNKNYNKNKTKTNKKYIKLLTKQKMHKYFSLLLLFFLICFSYATSKKEKKVCERGVITICRSKKVVQCTTTPTTTCALYAL